MRTIIAILVLVFAAQLASAQSTSLTGSGTSIDPYLIGSVNDLKFFRDKINETSGNPDTNSANVYDAVGAYFKLTADLDMSAESSAWVSVGNNPNVQNNFKGNFDGNNKTISNLTIGTSGTPAYQNPNSSLFGTASNSATIKNLTLANISFYLNRTGSGSFMVGGLAGQITAGVKIENCHVSGVINATNADNTNAADMEIGGLVGKIQRGPAVTPDLVQIINSSTNVNIVAKSTSTFAGANAAGDKKVFVAGIVGNYAATSFTNTPEIINSYSKGSVEGESTVNNSTRTSIQQVYVAGVWANNSGKLYNCYASGNLKGKTVTANVNVCGITGYINTGTLTKCYAVMDAIDITTTSGTQVGRRIANGTGTNQIISAYSLANTKVNGSAATLYITETEPNGLNISSADFITGLNAYVSANPTNNSVNLKTWAAVTASSNDVAKGAVAGVTKIPVLTGQSYSTTLTTTPTTGNHFVNWTLDTSGGAEQSTNASYSFTASANRTLVANFEPNTVPVSSGVTNASTITCTTCDVTVASGAELTVGATQTLKSVTVAAGGKLTLTAGTLSATNGITLESDANGTATMLQSGTLTGTVNAKQYLGSARNWYVSSPVSIAGAPATNMDYYYEYMEGGNNNDFATQPGSSSLYWKGIPNGTTMEVGKGYIAKTNAGTTVQFNGTPNNGDITTTFNLTRDDAKGKGFNLVGNPYPSYIDWTDVATANPNLENTYYYRTKNTNITNTYTFVTWNGAGAGSYVVSNGSLPANTSITRFIPPTQAFWVRVKSNPSSTKMYFNNGMREHRGNDDYNLLKTRKQDARTSIRLQLHNGTESDEMLVYFDANAANTFDSYDSPKMMNNSSITPDLYTKVDAERLVINGLNAISDNMELPLGFSLNSAASLKLKATEMSNFATGIKVYLLDKTDNIQTELLPETEYSFGTNSATLNNESRFSLLFRAPGSTTGIDNASKLNTQVFVNANNQISIIAPEKANYSIYNAVGQLIENGIVNLKYETRNTKLNAGVYVVKLNNQSTRIIIK